MFLKMKFNDYFGREIKVGDIIAHTNTAQRSGNHISIVVGFTEKRVKCFYISRAGIVHTARPKSLSPNAYNTIILSRGHNISTEKFVLNPDGTWKEEMVES